MNDVELTNALAGLGLDRSNYRAVVLLPLVEVAWADGRVQGAERQLIGKIAVNYGMRIDNEWLARWLKKRPTSGTFLAARTVLLHLMTRAPGGPIDPPETLEGLLDLCLGVAEAAGGLFGLAFTVEATERACIEEIGQSLKLGPLLPDTVIRAWNVAPPPSSATTAVHRRPKRGSSRPTLASAPPTLAVGPTTLAVGPTTLAVGSRPPSKPPSKASEDTTVGRPRMGADAFVEDDPTVPFFDEIGAAWAAEAVQDDD